MSLSLKTRNPGSYERSNIRHVEACTGNERLNKKAFLSMIGAKKYTAPILDFGATLEQQRLAEIQDVLDSNNGDITKAAAEMGITPSNFKRRYNMLTSRATSINDEPASPTPERRFFENLASRWSITSFSSKDRKVCIDVDAGPTVTHLSSKIPAPNNPV